jgi:hypothetical protein
MSEETKTPSREEMIQFYSEQIELKKLQVELQELNTRFIKAKAEEIQATAFIGQMMSEAEAVQEEEEENTPIQQPVDRKLKKDGDV